MTGFPRYFSGAALAMSALLVTGAAQAAANASQGHDPWTAVPAWPTACYSSQDKFNDQVNAARQTVQAERSQQEEINNRISAQTGPGGSEDPMEQARRMQEAMMKDPQHAMEQMQAMGAADPAATQQRALAVKTRYEEVKAGDKRFIAEYHAAKKAMLEPARSRAQALRKRADSQLVHTAEGDMWPEWAYQEERGIVQDANTAYGTFCATWFGTGGKVPAYLQQRKSFLVNERIPALDKIDATVTAQQMLGHSTEGYRSVAPYDAVDDYLVLAYDLFGLRNADPARCGQKQICEDQLDPMR